MSMMRRIIAALCVALALQVSALSAEYFVATHGDDANDGLGLQTAFATIQRGLDALETGDTLTIAPGEYYENARREDLGGPDADTVIRAQIPGAALLRGDIPAPEFEKVDAYRFVYAAPLDREPKAVLEHHTLHTLLPKANVAELEFAPGFFHYDADAGMLYISNRDLSSASERRYTIAASGEQGLLLDNPRRVVVEGLAATGFYPGWGINLNDPVSCVVRDCVAYFNVGGIRLGPSTAVGDPGGSDNLIEDCVAYANTFGGIVRYGANNDVIRGNYTYLNVREGQEHFGIMHYAGMEGPLLIKDNVSWGHNFNFSVKPSAQDSLETSVALGFIRNRNMSHNLVAGGNEYDRGSNAPEDNILFLRERDLDKDFEFADPMNLDFRLQPDSRFRGTAPDGSDRGPYQYEPNVFYVSPEGDDGADGLSMRAPWRTLDRALSALRPGDTLYLAEGEYTAAAWDGAGDGETPIRVRGRGRGTVEIRGGLSLAGAAGIEFERLNFPDGLALRDCRGISIKNCAFSGADGGLSAMSVEGLRVTHSLFADAPHRLAQGRGAYLSGNLHANANTPALIVDSEDAILYSDHNNYQSPERAWEVGGAMRSLGDVRPGHERYSHTIAPELDLGGGTPRLRNKGDFRSMGPHSTALGIHHEYDPTPKTLDLVGPFLHSASATTANIEWWTSHPATFSLAWGETPEMENTVGNVQGTGRFNSFSLTGLEPGQTYHFEIRSADARGADESLEVLRPEDAALTFQTDAEPAEPRVYHVAPDGDDANSGLSREQALRTVSRAATLVGPGDTVMIAEGEYNETVRIRAAGTPERPITFRSAPGEKAVFRGENLALSFEVVSKPDVRFDGFYFRGHGFWRQVFVVRDSARMHVTRCLNAMIEATDSPEMLVQNCVLRGGWSAVGLTRCPGSRVENNVSVMTLLTHLRANAPAVAQRNIFAESIRNKTHHTLVQLSADVAESDNCFYMRWPEDERLAINNHTLQEHRVRTGSNSFAANPMLPGIPGWRQGWQQTSDDDFDKFFSTNPKLVSRDIGLQPEAFADFGLGVADWPYDREWAESFLETFDAADDLAEAGMDAEALAAYTEMVERFPMSDPLRSDVLERASRTAQRLVDHDRAMELAKDIPVEVYAMRRQIELMLEREQYAEILDNFTRANMGGREFHVSFTYPELEDVMADLFYYRSLAHIQAGDLEAAEADLRIMNDKRTQLTYRCGEAIHDMVWLRLGDFYRDRLNDEDRALEAYLNVCDRTTWTFWGRPNKPAARGADETLVKATEAATDILRRRGEEDKARELEFSMVKAQAEAAASLLKEEETLAKFEELLGLPGALSQEVEERARRVEHRSGTARRDAIARIARTTDGLTDDERSILTEAAVNAEPQTRRVALRALLVFVPDEKADDLLAEER